MALDLKTMQELAVRLENAELQACGMDKITTEYPEMDMKDAYAIQRMIRQRKLDKGHRIVGFKAGVTSRAKMLQMKLETPVFGFLADYFAVPEGGNVPASELLQPRVEPEIGFVTKSPLKGPNCDIAAVLEATDFIVAAIEIIDSRFTGYKFDLPSVVADNCSSARFVMGSRIKSAKGLDLPGLGVVLEKNGHVVATGAGAAVLGHPAASVAMIVNQLFEQSEELPAGSIILSGGITEAVAVTAGDHVTLSIQHLGTVSVNFI